MYVRVKEILINYYIL